MPREFHRHGPSCVAYRERDWDRDDRGLHDPDVASDTTARQAFHRGYAVNFLSDATGTLAVANAAGSVTAEELHLAILVTQQMRFSKVMKTEEWVWEE